MMNRNLSNVLLGVATLVSLGWGFLEHRQVQRLRFEQTLAGKKQAEATDQVRQQLEQQQRSAQAMKANYESQIEQLTRKFAGKQLAEEERRNNENTSKSLPSQAAQAGATSQSQLVDASMTVADPGQELSADPVLAELAKNLQSLEINKMIERQQKLILDDGGGSLFKLLNLPENQLSAFKDLLVKKQTESMNVDLEVLNGQAPPEQRQANQTRIAETTSQIDGEIERLLGKENYEIYKAYEASQPERLQVERYNQSLGADLQINDAQINDLVWAMVDARSAFKFTTGLDQPYAAMDPAQVSPESIAQHMQETRQLNARYIERAGKLLSPPQLDKFRASLEQHQVTEENEMKKVLSGGQGEGTPGIFNQ